MSDEKTKLYLSREKIRLQIIEFAKDYLELENIDMTKSSFMSYIIEILSTLTSNILFYQTNIYNEFFLTKAQIPESVYNLSAFLGYDPSLAKYSSGDILVTFPFEFDSNDVTFTIPLGFEFKSFDGIPFLTDSEFNIHVIDNSNVEVTATRNNQIFVIPHSIDQVNNTFKIVVPTNQYKRIIQEFQLGEIEIYQFSSIQVPIDGQVASMDVYVREEDESTDTYGIKYTTYQSLYLIPSNVYGYVARKTNTGYEIFFGNDLIGKQPPSSGTVTIIAYITQGNDGNVISSSIKTGDRIYAIVNDVTVIINYTITNPSPAFGGQDEESIQDIKANAIQSISSMHRLVSEDDYKNITNVVPELPIFNNVVPVLKRSDIKINDILMFNVLLYNDNFVPSHNISYSFSMTQTQIPRDTVFSVDGDEYISIFDIEIDDLNLVGRYFYTTKKLLIVPNLIKTWSTVNQNPYHLYIESLTVEKIGQTVKFIIFYQSQESDYANIEALISYNSGIQTLMTNVPDVNGSGTLEYTYPDISVLPNETINFLFEFSNSNILNESRIAQYETSIIIKQSLQKFMMSNVVSDSTANIHIVYDIPVIQKSYMDNLTSPEEFEISVIQQFIKNSNLAPYKMLTDFVNMKLTTSIGYSHNMQYNPTTKPDVLDYGVTSLPLSGIEGDSYILGAPLTGVLEGSEFNIVTLTDSTAMIWIYTHPSINDMVYVKNKLEKMIFTNFGWKTLNIKLPLEIELEIIRIPNTDVSDSELLQNIRDSLYNTFYERFGSNINIYRSEIIDVVQNINGVKYCRLSKPFSNIFFKFYIDNFKEDDLLEYSPEWIYFTKESITIRLFDE